MTVFVSDAAIERGRYFARLTDPESGGKHEVRADTDGVAIATGICMLGLSWESARDLAGQINDAYRTVGPGKQEIGNHD